MSQLQKSIEAVKALPLIDVMHHFDIDYPEHLSHIKCPFPAHNATGLTPSFKFYQETNSFYCFGCKKAGSSIDFVMGMKELSFEKAIDYLIETFEVKIEASTLTKIIASQMNKPITFEKHFVIISLVKEAQVNELSFQEKLSYILKLYELFMEL